jgi:two-component system, chemotaxis family, chemotaxis protein CheY
VLEHPIRILIADDDRTVRMRLSRLLSNAGYQVVEAVDGRAALRATLTTTIDSILLDLAMPSMSGWEFRTRQLADAVLVKIPTFVTTPRSLSAHERYSLRLDPRDVIQKPFEDEVIIAKLEALFANPKPVVRRSNGRWRSRQGESLLWSRHGRVACEQHAPAVDSERWRAEGWAWIPIFAGKNKIEYACETCVGGPIHHARGAIAGARPPGAVARNAPLTRGAIAIART